MPAKKLFTHLVNFELLDYKIVRDFADEKGLGRKGFSLALRMILRDWFSLRQIAKNSSWFPKSLRSSEFCPHVSTAAKAKKVHEEL